MSKKTSHSTFLTVPKPAVHHADAQFANTTFTHAQIAVREAGDAELADEITQCIKDKTYSSSIAKRAVKVIQDHALSGDQWLIADLNKI